MRPILIDGADGFFSLGTPARVTIAHNLNTCRAIIIFKVSKTQARNACFNCCFQPHSLLKFQNAMTQQETLATYQLRFRKYIVSLEFMRRYQHM